MDEQQGRFNFKPGYGLAGFEELADTLCISHVRDNVARYIFAKICRTPMDKPIKGAELARLVEERFKCPCTSVTVRAVVSHCRVDLHIPFGSDTRGYYFAHTAAELEPSIHHLTRRMKRAVSVLSEVQAVQKYMRERESKV